MKQVVITCQSKYDVTEPIMELIRVDIHIRLPTHTLYNINVLCDVIPHATTSYDV